MDLRLIGSVGRTAPQFVKDAHPVYERLGFHVTKTPTYWMEIKDNDIYKKLMETY
jgi:hypothetical protein